MADFFFALGSIFQGPYIRLTNCGGEQSETIALTSAFANMYSCHKDDTLMKEPVASTQE